MSEPNIFYEAGIEAAEIEPKPKRKRRTKAEMGKAIKVDKFVEVMPAKVDKSPKAIDGTNVTRMDTRDGRFYEVVDNDGVIKHYPSVTTVLKAFPSDYLAQWRGNVGNEEADRVFKEAGERGTFIHKSFEDLLTGTAFHYREIPAGQRGFVIDDQTLFIQLYRLAEFMRLVNPIVLASEQIVYNHEYEFAGTIDMLLDIEDGQYAINGRNPVYLPKGVYLVDIKTANSIHQTHHWQLGAYAHCLTAFGYIIKGTIILHTRSLNKGGIEGFGAKLRSQNEWKEDFYNFLKVKSVFDINPKKPQIFNIPITIQLSKNYMKEL